VSEAMADVEERWLRTAECPLCGGQRRAWFARQGRHYERCDRCGLLSVPEGLARDSEGTSIYESREESVFASDGNDGYYFDHESNLANCRRKLRFVARHLTGGSRLLDAGANFGHFLKVSAGVYEARGFEISPSAVEWSRRHFGVDNVVGSAYAPPGDGAPWDAVTCWDVIEHLADPPAALQRMVELVRPGGWVFLSTPDAGSVVARAMGRRWHYLDPIQHLAVFSRKSLRALLERAGLQVVTVRALGHTYRVRYVLDRLCFLHQGGALGGLLRLVRALGRPVAGASIYLQLGDVMVVAARRAD
jgi:2-polyprenyl-3-methyl-5-hydroxy-6-metoxy-1,4-benzoquinol methylase